MQKRGFWNRVFNLEESPKSIQDSNAPKQVTLHIEAQGSSGTEIYSGYYSEDYLAKMNGTQRADMFDKMRRSDPEIKMLLGATKNPIKAGKWFVEAVDDSEIETKKKDLVEHILFNDLGKPWTQFVHEALSFVDFGHSIFEITDKVVMNHPKFGNYNGIKQIGFRSPRTIERFNLDPQTGNLMSITQYAYGDLQRTIDIPAEFLMVLTMDKEGDNYEGISWLRPCFGAYMRKDHHLKAEAIGIEKFAIPTPIMTIPENKETSPERTKAENVLKRWVTHQMQYIMRPVGWDLEFMKTEFDASKIRASIDAENKEMVHAFCANFLSLGQGASSSGSFALSFDLSDFFLGGLEHVGSLVCEYVNNCLVKRIIDLNYGPQSQYPKLKVSGISDKAGKELAETIKLLAEAKVIIPDDDLETNMRDRYGLSKKSDVGQREIQQQQGFGQQQSQPQPLPQQTPKLSEVIKLEEPKKQIKSDKEILKETMQLQLAGISKNLVDQLMKFYRNNTPSNRINGVKQMSPKGVQEYKKELLNTLAEISASALKQARKEVPKAKNIRLSEKLVSIMLGEFESLPADVQKRLKAQSDLIVDTQIADLQKNIAFTFQSSIESTDSESLIEFDLHEAGGKFIDGPSVESGSGTIAAQVVNEARTAFFFDDEVLKEIESFTFVNGDPVSPICQDLAGTVFAKDDPNMDRYTPPLHHNAVITGTLIRTDNGDVPIEKLKVGDKVLTHENRFMEVTEFMDRFEDKHYFEIELENGKKINITAEHPILTKNGWVKIEQLLLTDEIVCIEDISNALD